jgi:hypothetical protein
MKQKTDRDAAYLRHIDRIVCICKMVLAHHDEDEQCAALTELVASYIAIHHPATREEVIETFVKDMRRHIPAAEAELFPDGYPEGWATQ